jgi:hypothetical protein
MSTRGTEVTPSDELTGLPLSIYTRRPDFFNHPRNFHHHFHPSNSPDLQGYYDGKAVRYSRGQDIQMYLHDRYHDIFHGPPLPETRRDKFVATVLSLSGVVPREAIDLYTPGEAQIVGLTKGEHRFISGSKRMHLELDRRSTKKSKQHERIGRFFADYIVEQALEDVISYETIDKFLHGKDEKERRQLGRTLLETAVDSSVAELVPIHEQARKEGMVVMGAVAVKQVVESYFSPGKFYQSLLTHAPAV